MRFQLLGTVSAYDQRGQVELGPAKQRTVLAVMLVELGMAVSVDQLIDRVWGVNAPQRAHRTLHSYLSRLRGVLTDASGATLSRRGADYALEADESAVDIYRFRALVTQARRVADCDRAAKLWQEALELWQGAPFSGLSSEWLRAVAVRLEAELHAATLDRTDVLLRRGEHHRLLPELATAAAANPLDERLAGQLMLALYRSGRQSDALAHYRRLHDRLVEELGSDPGAQLRELHQQLLRQDPELECGLDTGKPALASSVGVGHRPAQLPANVAAFTGREADLRRLDAILDGAPDGQHPQAVVITAIGGTAGVGKTALAVYWGHKVADRFPDGQLYLNLRGYDPKQPVSPADALARLLTALGIAGQDLPVDLDERAARYRSELAERQMLIVLDNAASVEQVRPLLPGGGSCRVVVTSRDSLAGLVAVHGAHRIDLDLLTRPEAVGLLKTLIGPAATAEPEATAALAEQCARLPLALRVAAELVSTRPGVSLADLVADLADRQRRLELLETDGDPYAAVREVFSWSLHHLPAETVPIFRLLGLHPGPDLDAYAVAALAETTSDIARSGLERLARAHLVHRTAPGRYGMHDLLRAYAAQLEEDEHDPAGRQAAQDRLLGYYRSAASLAMDVLHPADATHRPQVPTCPTPLPELATPNAAHTWLAAERLNVSAIAAHAATYDDPYYADYLVGLARILHRYVESAIPTDGLILNESARQAAVRAGDLGGEAWALRQLGAIYNRLGDYERALYHLEQALEGFLRVGDRVGEAMAHTATGITRYRMGDHEEALNAHLRAAAVARENGDRLTEGYALGNLGVVEERTGRYPEALEHQQQAVAALLELGATYGAGIGLNNLANVEMRQGDYAAAAGHLKESLDILQQIGSKIAEAHTWDTLGQLHLRLNEPEQASGEFRRALDIYRNTGDRVGQAWSLNGLGEVAGALGEYAEASAWHREAIVIGGQTRALHQIARAHAGLGNVFRALGDSAQAREHYQLAVTQYTELDMLEAEEVRAALATLDS